MSSGCKFYLEFSPEFHRLSQTFSLWKNDQVSFDQVRIKGDEEYIPFDAVHWWGCDIQLHILGTL